MRIGAVIQLVEIAQLQRAFTFEEIKSTAIRCEEFGFDSLWVYDHLLYREKKDHTTGIWESWTMLSALAAVTKRVTLGTLVTCNSFRNPALLAKMAHTVDEISGGRLVLGLGAGWNQPEYDAFGYPFDRRVDRFEEALQIIHPLLKEGKVDFSGTYYKAHNCEITPCSPRPGGPPLLIGGSRERMLQLTARYADIWNVGYMSIPRSVDSMKKKMDKACKVEGRDPQTLRYSYMVSLAFPDLAGWEKDKKRGYLVGAPEELALALKEYEARGASELMFHIIPSSPEGYERLAKAIEIYRKM
ncbi:MAG TPA: LLM class flavin-dependent oxidoreductase [Anaerolineaceae bacterium]|nr:LLM class flavin-dependent oxidoreductase [Anaerolineaceae bacterium]